MKSLSLSWGKAFHFILNFRMWFKYGLKALG